MERGNCGSEGWVVQVDGGGGGVPECEAEPPIT